MIETVQCYIIKDDSYLMLRRDKKENDMNEGKYIGVGGHVEAFESIDDACRREILEETGLIVNSLKYHGKVLFVNDDYEEMMHIYTSDDFKGNLIDCDEGTLCWIKIDDILNLNIWEGDKIFLPKLKTNEIINIKVIYKNDKFIGWCNL